MNRKEIVTCGSAKTPSNLGNTLYVSWVKSDQCLILYIMDSQCNFVPTD